MKNTKCHILIFILYVTINSINSEHVYNIFIVSKSYNKTNYIS